MVEMDPLMSFALESGAYGDSASLDLGAASAALAAAAFPPSDRPAPEPAAAAAAAAVAPPTMSHAAAPAQSGGMPPPPPPAAAAMRGAASTGTDSPPPPPPAVTGGNQACWAPDSSGSCGGDKGKGMGNDDGKGWGKGWDEWSKGGCGGGEWGWSQEYGGYDEWGKGGGGDWGKGGGDWGKGGGDWSQGGGDWGKGGDWGAGGWKGDGKGKGKTSDRGKGKGSTKGGQRVAAGETAYSGVVRSWNAEKKMAYIACEQLYWETGQDVYGHHTVVQSAGIGPGDTVIFFVHWSARGQPQASDPILRVKAGDGGYALKGIYTSGKDMEKGFGFISCPELKDIYGRDVYVPKEIAYMLVSGQTVCYNVKINKEGMPNAEAAVPCDESWQPIAPDLSYTREVDVATGLDKGKGKGYGHGHSHGQKDENRLTATGKYYTGYLKSFKEASGWGFISADDVRAQYGTDAFVLNSQLRNTRKYIGEWVQFEVGINDRGQPQAMNVQSMDGADVQAPDAKRPRLDGPMTAVDGVGPQLASTAAVAPGIGDTPAGGGLDGALS